MTLTANGALPRVAVIGSGYWGRNLVRNFHQLGSLCCVCDTRQDARNEAAAAYNVRTTDNFGSVLSDAAIEAVAIATPAAQHYECVRAALNAGKHVYVEKPLALRVEDGEELVQLSAKTGRILMVGHILEYHPAILELRKLIREGDLGKIQYIHSSRLNLGKLRTEENILWSFAPHDLSAILFLLGETPVSVSAHGGSYLHQKMVDTTLTTLQFRSGVNAHIFVSWLHPFKEQKLAIVADKKMAVFDDVESERKLVLYPHRIDWLDRTPVAHREPGQVIPLPKLEPLREECAHFLHCIATGERARTDGESALRVLRLLDRCEESLRRGGHPVEVTTATPAYFAHPTAIIDEPCEIGKGTKIWHFSHVMANSRLGAGCNLGQNVLVSPGVIIGNNVKIQNNVSIYTGVELEDDVFCGPSMVFTNVVNPRSHIVRKNEYRKTLVKQGASLGANSTVVCGITVGRYAFVAAGATVTRDVPNYALVAGVPAKWIGWVCYCGVTLKGDGSERQCLACGRAYHIHENHCEESTTTGAPPITASSAAASD